MRKGLEGQAFEMLSRAVFVLLALGLLAAVAPAAMASEGGHLASAADCCSSTPASCDVPSAACSVQVCQQTSALGREVAHTATFTAVISEPARHDRIVSAPETAATLPPALASPGPPASLRFHRLLL